MKGIIEMGHGSGGRRSAELIQQLFLRHFDNPALNAGNDFAELATQPGRIVMATDSHVITPLFFPGGDIGALAVHGTINDVAMSGAKPIALSAGFILEEGLPLEQLERIVISMAAASREAGVPIVTGDTKVVERGHGDGVYINSTGIGVVPDGIEIDGSRARAGDKIILSGAIGEHGVAILSHREGLSFETDLCSDSAALHTLVADMVATGADIHVLRDPTRGGVATTLNELARQSNVGICIDECAIPIKPAVQGACELLGLDPLYIANEGKLLAIVAADDANTLLAAMHNHPLAADAAIIGEVVEDRDRLVVMQTRFGGRRVVDWLAGEQLPRIC